MLRLDKKFAYLLHSYNYFLISVDILFGLEEVHKMHIIKN